MFRTWFCNTCNSSLVAVVCCSFSIWSVKGMKITGPFILTWAISDIVFDIFSIVNLESIVDCQSAIMVSTTTYYKCLKLSFVSIVKCVYLLLTALEISCSICASVSVTSLDEVDGKGSSCCSCAAMSNNVVLRRPRSRWKCEVHELNVQKCWYFYVQMIYATTPQKLITPCFPNLCWMWSLQWKQHGSILLPSVCQSVLWLLNTFYWLCHWLYLLYWLSCLKFRVFWEFQLECLCPHAAMNRPVKVRKNFKLILSII